MLHTVLAVCLLLLMHVSHAQVCPSAGTPLNQVRIAVDDYIRSGRAPAGADCAYSWASGFNFGDASLNEDVLLFFRTATDVQRTAANLRLDSGNKAGADGYLKREIELRQSFIKEAMSQEEPREVARLRSSLVQNLSYVAAAMALRSQYEQVVDMLGDQDPGYVDREALKVWLQALWSCANWDGKKVNICGQEKKQICREKISIFLDAVANMGDRKLAPQTRNDIDGLRKITDKNGCLP
jgi:hypothetical protein